MVVVVSDYVLCCSCLSRSLPLSGLRLRGEMPLRQVADALRCYFRHLSGITLKRQHRGIHMWLLVVSVSVNCSPLSHTT